MMVPGCHWRQEAGCARLETVKMSTLIFLLVVLQVSQDPPGRCRMAMENMPIPTTVSCTGDREETESAESQSASVSVNPAALKLKSLLMFGLNFFEHCSDLQC